jgi:hypothetical protein
MGEMRNEYKIFVQNLKVRNGRWRDNMWRCALDLAGSGYGPMVDFLKV